MNITKQEAHEKLRKQLELGIIRPEEFAQKCVEILTEERLIAEGFIWDAETRKWVQGS